MELFPLGCSLFCVWIFLAHGLNGRIRGWNSIHLDDIFLRTVFLAHGLNGRIRGWNIIHLGGNNKR